MSLLLKPSHTMKMIPCEQGVAQLHVRFQNKSIRQDCFTINYVESRPRALKASADGEN